METSLYYMHLQYVMCFSLYFFHVTFRLSTKIQIFRLLILSPLLIKSDIFIVHYDIIPGLYLPCDIIRLCAMLHLNFLCILGTSIYTQLLVQTRQSCAYNKNKPATLVVRNLGIQKCFLSDDFKILLSLPSVKQIQPQHRRLHIECSYFHVFPCLYQIYLNVR